jgi:hypothetical protein
VRFGQVRAVGDGAVQAHVSVGIKWITLADIVGGSASLEGIGTSYKE